MSIEIEKNPFMRAVYDAGYTEVLVIDDQISFLVDQKVVKTCTRWDILNLNLTIKGGEYHRWISDGDGSSDRLRKFLSIQNQSSTINT